MSEDVQAQSTGDSSVLIGVDSVWVASVAKIDSAALLFQTKADSLTGAFEKRLANLETQQRKLQHALDSLTKLRLPTSKLERKIDSLQTVKQEKIGELTKQLDQLKEKVTGVFDNVNLPPQLQQPLDQLKSSIASYSPSITSPSSSLLATGKGLNSLFPGAPSAVDLDKSLASFKTASDKFTRITRETKKYTDDLKALSSGQLSEAKNINQKLETEAIKKAGVGELTEKAGVITAMRTDSAAVSGMIKSMAAPEVKKQMKAINHFAGFEELLANSMNQLAEVKNKADKASGLRQLVNRSANTLKGKSLFQRLVPGITFETQSATDFLLDVNFMARYRVRPRLSVGMGWVQRLVFAEWNNVNAKGQVYGSRALTEVEFNKGICFSFQPELLNSEMPGVGTNGATLENGTRTWAWAMFTGLKKRFRVYRSINGHTEALYNLSSTNHRTLHSDRFVVRFGFEFPGSKRTDKVDKSRRSLGSFQ